MSALDYPHQGERTKQPRRKESYRGYLRNNALEWSGVKPDGSVSHPPLIRKVSQRGEVHYV